MAFNSLTYYRNKYRRKALAELAEARSLKKRVADGDAYGWEAARVATFVTLARLSWRIYLSAPK